MNHSRAVRMDCPVIFFQKLYENQGYFFSFLLALCGGI